MIRYMLKVHVKDMNNLFTQSDIDALYNTLYSDAGKIAFPIYDFRVMDGGREKPIGKFSCLYFYLFGLPDHTDDYLRQFTNATGDTLKRLSRDIMDMDVSFNQLDNFAITKTPFPIQLDFMGKSYEAPYTSLHYMYERQSEALIYAITKVYSGSDRLSVFTDSCILPLNPAITHDKIEIICSNKDTATFDFVETLHANQNSLDISIDRLYSSMIFDEYELTQYSNVLLGYDYVTNVILFKKLLPQLLKFHGQNVCPIIYFPVPVFQAYKFEKEVKDKYILFTTMNTNTGYDVVIFSV